MPEALDGRWRNAFPTLLVVDVGRWQWLNGIEWKGRSMPAGPAGPEGPEGPEGRVVRAAVYTPGERAPTPRRPPRT